MNIYRLATLILLSISSTALCHIFIQVGVNSNIVVDEGKVYFAQSDRSLTVLNLETGAVIARKHDNDYAGTFLLVEDYRGSCKTPRVSRLRRSPRGAL